MLLPAAVVMERVVAGRPMCVRVCVYVCERERDRCVYVNKA
jgi:hypothetical protein